MIPRYLLPLLAIAGFALAVYTVVASARPLPPAAPAAPPAEAPFVAYVAGSGIVEASTRNIEVGTFVAGIVTDLFVEAGDRVKADDKLFRIDARELEAELQVRQAALFAAQARLMKLQEQPRPEDIPPAEARVKAADAALSDAQSKLAMWESVGDARAVSREEIDRRRFEVYGAEARLAEAKSQLDLLKAGAWAPDIAVAQAEVAAAEAQTRQSQINIDLLLVRAPVDGQVLQVNLRAGEFAATGVGDDPLVLLGDIDTLHIRVDVDENDAWRVQAGAPAMAFLRGNSQLKTPIQFVRFEPFVVPKRSLTGASTERVDTRVLQVLYRFNRKDLPVYVGQQMDVFIESPPLNAAMSSVESARAQQ
jgi:multidrug efflux pump subunit AcrA (membrane-fusion protein)